MKTFLSKNIKNIHMIGICGVAMGSLAGMLNAAGYSVQGSDERMYPPMSDMLKKWDIRVFEGFNEGNIGDSDIVIIGNAISRGNAEAEAVLNKRIPYMSLPQALYDFFLKDREVIAVAGTHGKTTTTALLAHIMETAGMSPSFFIGGVSNNYNSNYKLGTGRYFIIEGDEYDSAFFEKIPKFILYRPYHCVLTSLEFDHADIYNNVDEIELWFERLINIVPSEGNIVYSNEYNRLAGVVSKSRSKCRSFGASSADFNYEFAGHIDNHSRLNIHSRDYGLFGLETRIFGSFNFANIAAAVGMSAVLGIDRNSIQNAVKSFTGVKRRQELIYNKNNIKIFEDFAHHPTAIRLVLDEMRKRYPESAIWAIYEPRSATSRRNVFQNELPGSFNAADYVIMKTPYRLDAVPEKDRLDVNKIISTLKKNGRDAMLIPEVDGIIEFVIDNIKPDRENIIIIMSNGGFDGIYSKMIDRVARLT